MLKCLVPGLLANSAWLGKNGVRLHEVTCPEERGQVYSKNGARCTYLASSGLRRRRWAGRAVANRRVLASTMALKKQGSECTFSDSGEPLVLVARPADLYRADRAA